MNGVTLNGPSALVSTFASRQHGSARLIGPLLAMVLFALPFTWQLPLFRTELLVFIENEVTVVGAVQTLVTTDLLLCAIVILFGMVFPFMKLLTLLYTWFVLPPTRAQLWINAIGKVSKFSMLDVMLIAITIVGLKGVGLGKVEIEYGLYAYAVVVLSVLFLSFWMEIEVNRISLQLLPNPAISHRT
jgi:paraquat-inducible protein A